MPSENSQINPSTIVRTARAAGSQPYLPSGFQGRCKIATLHAGFGVIRGMSDETNVLYVFVPDCGDESFRLFQNVFFEFANKEFQSDPDVQISRFRPFMGVRTRTQGGVFGPTITGGR